MPKFYQTKYFLVLQEHWEKKLEESGFVDIERPSNPAYQELINHNAQCAKSFVCAYVDSKLFH